MPLTDSTAASSVAKQPEADSDRDTFAQFNADIEALPPEERARVDEVARRLIRILSDEAKHLKSLLERLGIKGELGWPTLMAAWRSVNLPIEDFGRSNFRDLIEILEPKVRVLDRNRDRGSPTSRLLLKKAGMMGGRPPDVNTIDVEKLRQVRGAMTQKSFARKCGKISVDTLQRAERGDASRETFRKIVAYLKKRDANFKPGELMKKNPPQQPQ
jgi:hypothetical protein